jgi:hypothetical protein
LSRRVLFGDLKEGGYVHVGIENETLTFEIKEKLVKMTKAARKKLGLLDEEPKVEAPQES